MIEHGWNHHRIVQESLCGERAVDEQSFASLAILSERLERLKKLDWVFCDVKFSAAVENLRARRAVVAVG